MYSGGILKHVLNASGTNGHPPLPPVVLQSYVSPFPLFPNSFDKELIERVVIPHSGWMPFHQRLLKLLEQE